MTQVQFELASPFLRIKVLCLLGVFNERVVGS